MLDILIQDGSILDGTGRLAFKADLGIANGRIVQLASRIEQEAHRTIQASGLDVAPGFIDPHTHSDLTLFAEPRAESKIRQGVTTEIVGNCGDSPAPLHGAALKETQSEAEHLDLEVTWLTMAEYVECLKKQGIALNVVPLVGHNTVRGAVLGYDDVQPNAAQQSKMEQLVAEAMEQGARGLSSGLVYPPGLYAKTEEVIGLAKVAARYHGIYASHIRNESDQLFEAVSEAIEISRSADIRVEIAHLKLEGYRNWQGADRLLALIDQGSANGVRVGCDQYPYTASGTWLASILPQWAQAGGTQAVAERLKDPGLRAKFLADYPQNLAEWENRGCMHDWTDVVVSSCPAHPETQGKSIAQIAEEEGKERLEAALDLIVASEGWVSCVFFSQLEDNVRTIMRHASVVVGSDGNSLAPYGSLSRRKPHPRSYGTFPRVLARYVREEKVLSLEEAVQKMTSMTAERYGLRDRGTLKEGSWADLVLFDADAIEDKATFADPHQYPVGIPYVIVNGKIVIDEGQHTGVLPGQVL